MSKLLEKQKAVQEKLSNFTEQCILAKNIVKDLAKSGQRTEYFILLAEKLNKNYPLAPWRKEELLLSFLDKIEFTSTDEFKIAVEQF